MSSLQVRELPDNLYRLLQKKAQKEHRSLSQEAIAVLAKGLNTSISHQDRRQELLQEINAQAVAMQTSELPAPADLIHEDRRR